MKGFGQDCDVVFMAGQSRHILEGCEKDDAMAFLPQQRIAAAVAGAEAAAASSTISK